MKRFINDEQGIESVDRALIFGLIILTAAMAAVGAQGFVRHGSHF